MPIEFSCSSCGTTLRVPDEHAGKQARCPKCQALNTIPAASSSGTTQPSPFPEPTPSPAAAQPAQPPMGHPVSNPYGATQGNMLPPGGVGGRAYQTAHRGALVLTMGIISIFCNAAMIPGILAWVLGRADLREMDAGRMDPEGRGATTAGMIIGIIMTILGIIGIVFVILYIIFIFFLIGVAANA